MFPLFSQAGNDENSVEQQLEKRILMLINDWQKTLDIEQIKPQLTIRSNRSANKLVSCKQPLQFTKKSDKLIGLQQWKITCKASNRSAIVRSQLSIKALLPVAIESLARGHVITEQDIQQRWVNYPKSQTKVINHISQLINKRIKHKLRRFKPIKANQLLSNIWVTAGEQVIIEANTDGFTANMKGEALQSGGEGQAIKVKNLSSGTVIVAYPIAKGKVATRF